MNTFRIAALLSCLFGASVAFAQNDASVSGTVTDSSGARVAGATVTALNTATGVATPVPTNDAGAYTMPGLPPATYTFTAEHAGFRKESIEGVVLQVGSFLTLNLGLQVGAASETVTVQATATEVNATSSSVGNVLEGKRVLDLPLIGRSSYDLLATQPGVVLGISANYYLNGNQTGAINITTDGIATIDPLHQGAAWLYTNSASIDRVEEFRVVTSGADAEYGRGSGQVQLVTRGGTNKFVGSAWWEVYNGDLNANNWFNNQAGSNANGTPLEPRTQLKQNNFGARFGGPVGKQGHNNKTFFNFLWDPSIEKTYTTENGLVYTQTALDGIFRFFPGVANENAAQANPAVTTSGQPIAPVGATGPLQSVSVLGRDPNRMAPDSTGIVSHVLGLYPLPNNYLIGDGLNTGGYTFQAPFPYWFYVWEGRVDHVFNEKNRISLTANYNGQYQHAPSTYPDTLTTNGHPETTEYSAALTTILSPSLINVMRMGIFRAHTHGIETWLAGTPASNALLPTIDGIGTLVDPTANLNVPYAGTPNKLIDSVWQYGDDLTWIKGRHSFKGGFQARLTSFSGYAAADSPTPFPVVQLGAPSTLPATNISTGTNPIAGLVGTNVTTATNLLYDLTGSVASASQVNISAGGTNPVFLPGLEPYHNYHQPEYDAYFKDDFKVTPSLTLNLGVRWELYVPPDEAQGKGVAPVGGGAAVFGISGTTFASLFNPDATGGALTTIEGIGPHTANPNTPFYNTDWKNFSPNLGLAWSLPGDGRWKWLTGGKDQSTFRMGYGIGYQRFAIGLVDTITSSEPGLVQTATALQYTNVGNVQIPVEATGAPLSLVPETGTGSHTQSLYAYNQNLRTPYAQNWNATLTRALPGSLVMEVAYVGSKGSELVDTVNTNEVNIYENGLLNAFNTVRAGGDSPLIDQIFSNSYATVAAAGSGSNYVRTNSATNGFIANNNPGGLANYISTTNALSGVVGGLLLNAKLPLNFVVANPQFLNTYLISNFGNSTYNSLQVQVKKRFSQGFTIQSSYVWSHTLGFSAGDAATFLWNFRTLRNESLDKEPLPFDYQSVFKINGIYELPFGEGKLIGRNMNGFLDRIVGGWQFGAIGQVYSGAPLTLLAQDTINNTGNTNSNGFTPILLGALPADGATRVGNGVVYFNGLTQITDPSVASLPAALQSVSTLKAIATSNGTPLLVNPAAGVLGSLGLNSIRGPGGKSLNVNLIKHFRINERFNMEIRATANNVTNTPIWGAPNVTISSTGFGRITTATGNRVMVLQARVNF